MAHHKILQIQILQHSISSITILFYTLQYNTLRYDDELYYEDTLFLLPCHPGTCGHPNDRYGTRPWCSSLEVRQWCRRISSRLTKQEKEREKREGRRRQKEKEWRQKEE